MDGGRGGWARKAEEGKRKEEVGRSGREGGKQREAEGRRGVKRNNNKETSDSQDNAMKRIGCKAACVTLLVWEGGVLF